MRQLTEYRKARGLTQAQLAAEVGLRSKGSISMIEVGVRSAPIQLALRIEDHSDGQVEALSLVDAADAALLRRFAARRVGTPEPRTIQDRPAAIGGRA